MRPVYYNDNDKKAAAWIMALIDQGHLPQGDVDERSIADVEPGDLVGYGQCHFFAGIGGWAYALRLAGWPDEWPVWTGSCPCQPLSGAGQRKGHADERHLWPAFHSLIAECRPAAVLGEQVAGKDGREWLAAVRADLEAAGYACGAADLCAAGAGAPHIRQRLYWGAQRLDHAAGARHGGALERAEGDPRDGERLRLPGAGREAGGLAGADGGNAKAEGVQRGGQQRFQPQDGGVGGLADADGGVERPQVGAGDDALDRQRAALGRRPVEPAGAGAGGGVGDGHSRGGRGEEHATSEVAELDRPCPPDSPWRAADWLYCRDGKWRPVESSAQQMVDGLSRAMGRLRADLNLTKEIGDASKAFGITGEILREVRSRDDTLPIWLSLGRCVGFPQATFLLAVLCQQSRELGYLFGREASRVEPMPGNFMRAVREHTPQAACPSQGWEHSQQRFVELRDALSKLSQADAFGCVSQFTASPLARGASSRVGKLRGYGNAIVPQVAAAFAEAFAEALP